MQSAENIFAGLGTGILQSIHRPNNPTEDRNLRNLIENANLNGDLIIPTGSRGYYRPDMNNEAERCEAINYLNKEQARINTMSLKIHTMIRTFHTLSSTDD